MSSVTFLHTAEIHVATFDRLMKETAPDLTCHHVVREEWLAEARANGLNDDLQNRVSEFLENTARSSDAVLCTCSTLGPLADDAQAAGVKVLRIDRPMMEHAVSLDGTIMVALCLESTIQPTLELLRETAKQANRPGTFTTILCAEAWPYFEQGDLDGFRNSIAGSIRSGIAEIEQPSCIVLAQASMAGATSELECLDIPILSSPGLAVAELVKMATSRI